MALKDKLVLHASFSHDPALFPVHDNSDNGNHLIPDGFSGELSGTYNVTGLVGKAIIVPAVGHALETVHSSKITHQGAPFTLGLWFKLPLPPAAAVSILSSDEYAYTVGPTSSVVTINLDALGAQASINLGAAPTANAWHFLMFGYYTNNGSFFWASMDFEAAVRVAAPSPPFAIFESTLTLAGRPCIFDELAIWRRAVTAEELWVIYNDPKGKGTPKGLAFSEWDKAVDCKTLKCCP